MKVLTWRFVILNSKTSVDMVERFCTLLINCLFGKTDSSRAAFFILFRDKVMDIKVKVNVKVEVKVKV